MQDLNLLTRVVVLALLTGSSLGADTWVVRDDGVGPAKIGMSLAQLSLALHEKFSMTGEKDDQGCFYVNARGHDHIAFMIENGRLVRIDVDEAGVPTLSAFRSGTRSQTPAKFTVPG